jgi:DNA-binding SARP family transcriptional activator
LLEAHRQNIEREQALVLLSKAGQQGVVNHPGYTLWVRCLSSFSAWRGDRQIPAHEWQREKARQLLQLLITRRGQWLSRDQIVDLLWPDLPAENAARDFKVALNALNHALEPRRLHNLLPYFIIRKANTYGINPQAMLVTDIDIFNNLATSSDVSDLQRAITLYEEDFLPDCLYSDWCSTERHAYRQKLLAVTERLAQLHLHAQRWEAAIEVCQAALRRDQCWEPAYAQMIQAYIAQGETAQALAVYQRCEAVLWDELAVTPSDEIQKLRRSIGKLPTDT